MNVAQNRLTQVFKFLKDLNGLRNPVPREMSSYAEVLRLDEWPAYPLIEVRRGDRTEEDNDAASEAQMEPLIRIRRANLTACPKPPELLDGWLKPGWQSVEARPEVLTSRNFPDKREGTTTVAFEDDVERVAALNAWIAVRTKWATAERPTLTGRRLFERVHALWTATQREGDRVELVLGDGMLSTAHHEKVPKFG